MFKLLFSGAGVLFLLTFTNVYAQDNAGNLIQEDLGLTDPEEDLSVESGSILPIIESADVIEVGKNIIFDASKTQPGLPEAELSYVWQFSDGNRAEGVEVVNAFVQPGEYQVQLLVRDDQGREAIAIKDVFVYRKSFLLISDKSSERERIETLLQRARIDRFVHIKLLESFDSVSEFIAEEAIIRDLKESLEEFNRTDFIVLWTEGSLGLTALSHFSRSLSDQELDFSNKTIIFIYDGNLDSFENIAAGVYKSIRPRSIVLTRSESVWPLIESEGEMDFFEEMKNRVIDFRVVDQSSLIVRPWNVFSTLVNFMMDNGVPSNTVILILMLPIMVTIISFLRQVIGVSTLGVYTPLIITLSFIALDIKISLIILMTVMIVGTCIRLVLRNYRLLYVPRVAIVFTVVSMALLALLLFGSVFSVVKLVSISIFPMLMMVTLVEKFVDIQYDHGFKPALFLMIQTLLVSVLCFYIVELNELRTFVLAHPEVILLALVFNIILGRWSGLRLMEYVRFRHILAITKEE